MSNHVDEIRLMACDLAVGAKLRAVCPHCGGGSGGETSLDITREPTGLRWICYRNSCTMPPGGTVEMGELLPDSKPAERYKLKPFTGRLHQLNDEDMDYFFERFNIDPLVSSVMIRVTDRGEYAFDIDDPLERTRGVLVRQPIWGGLPRAPRDGVARPDYPKTLNFMHARGPVQAWYRVHGGKQIVLVEDCVSAMRVLECGVSSVALLGTHLDAEKVREIAQQRPDEVIIALDEDATSQAFKLAQKWGLAWKRTRVAILPCDIKDMESDEAIVEALGL